MKEYKYSPATVPYKVVSKIKQCKGESPGCLKKFISATNSKCVKCRNYEQDKNGM